MKGFEGLGKILLNSADNIEKFDDLRKQFTELTE